MGRRANGEGSIFKRADGRWAGQITLGKDINGKIHRRTVYGRTRNAVVKKLAPLKKQHATIGKPQTIAEFLDQWLENDVEKNLKATTHDAYERASRLRIKPLIGHVRLEKLTPANVRAWINNMQKLDTSPRKVAEAFSVLRKALNVAVRETGEIDSNPCLQVNPPAYSAPEAKYLTPGQMKAVIAGSVGHKDYAFIVLALTTGLRLGELSGLEWSDIDMERASLTVRRTVSEVNSVQTITSPKTKKSRRRVKLSAIAVEALRGHSTKEGLVFPAARTKYLTRTTVQQQIWKPALKRAGVEYVNFHSARHTAASLLLASAIHPKIVQERLGHSKIGTTLDIYGHLIDGMDEAAASAIDEAMS